MRASHPNLLWSFGATAGAVVGATSRRRALRLAPWRELWLAARRHGGSCGWRHGGSCGWGHGATAGVVRGATAGAPAGSPVGSERREPFWALQGRGMEQYSADRVCRCDDGGAHGNRSDLVCRCFDGGGRMKTASYQLVCVSPGPFPCCRASCAAFRVQDCGHVTCGAARQVETFGGKYSACIVLGVHACLGTPLACSWFRWRPSQWAFASGGAVGSGGGGGCGGGGGGGGPSSK